jgi:hypothetical protein
VIPIDLGAVEEPAQFKQGRIGILISVVYLPSIRKKV